MHHGAMGFEVLGEGSDGRPDDAAARRSPVQVHDLDAAPESPPAPAPRRALRPPVRATALALVALVVGGGVAVGRHEDAPPPRGRTTVTEDASPALSTSTDLTTAVTVAHVVIAGRSAAEQVRELQDAFAGSSTGGARVTFVPEEHAFDSDGPTGVNVVFDRYLDSALQRHVSDVIGQVGPQHVAVETVRGTAVDISVPATPGAPCMPVPGFGAAQVSLTDAAAAQVEDVLAGYRAHRTRGHATITYVGLVQSQLTLQLVGDVLARACGRAVGEVSLTRPAALG